MGTEETIIISGYRQKVSYYGWFTCRAWVFAAAPVVAFLVGLAF